MSKAEQRDRTALAWQDYYAERPKRAARRLAIWARIRSADRAGRDYFVSRAERRSV